MSGVHYIIQGDKRILLIDLAGISDFRILPEIVGKAIHLVQTSESPGSLRTLVDLTGTQINTQILSSLKSLSRNNGRYAKATAFTGLKAFWSSVLSTLLRARGKRNHRVFRNRSEALLWLDQQ